MPCADALCGFSAERIGLYILPLAVGNFLGPLFVGRFFDTVGRRRMISTTFGLPGLLLIIAGVLFATGRLSEVSQTVSLDGHLVFRISCVEPCLSHRKRNISA